MSAGSWPLTPDLLGSGLSPMPSGLEPIAEAKLRLGRGAVNWLRHRLTHRT